MTLLRGNIRSVSRSAVELVQRIMAAIDDEDVAGLHAEVTTRSALIGPPAVLHTEYEQSCRRLLEFVDASARHPVPRLYRQLGHCITVCEVRETADVTPREVGAGMEHV